MRMYMSRSQTTGLGLVDGTKTGNGVVPSTVLFWKVGVLSLGKLLVSYVTVKETRIRQTKGSCNISVSVWRTA